MENVRIEKVTEKDLTQLVAISRQTFTETFAADNSEEDLLAFLDEAYALKQLEKELKTAGSSFYFCQVGEEIAGYLKVNRDAAQSEDQGDDAFEIERIYFLSDFQGKGLGSRFFNYAETLARAAGKSRLWLGVWEHNERALAVYQKKGFRPFSDHVFQVGDDKQRDLLMEKNL
ncbi:GNAT family N-acetyltransferase [Fructobacillus sp. M158]|uniref:GNAT family N-acetyltransferase n=1 Tax=Fructobacillus parabroussonetiae TaxID=2713174 RepID=UPI002009EF9C|nr:GNAT family N-acetyltransferase [Fructobacillus parabroussonetiae]MCK8617894.1 GNAT family N-acetyltransferase [Fructobacillus parabroussonetiae]